MSPDTALIAFTALGFASVFLALIIGLAGGDARKLVSALASLTPAARRQARIAHLDYLTGIADEAIAAARDGKASGRAKGAQVNR